MNRKTVYSVIVILVLCTVFTLANTSETDAISATSAL